LGIGDWAQSPIPNPQSPIPNPQSPIPIYCFYIYVKIILLKFYVENKIFKLNKWIIFSIKKAQKPMSVILLIINIFNL
jgi:hypothetical protein